MDGKEWYSSEQETRIIPILAFRAFDWDFSLWVVGSEAEYGVCSPCFMDAADLGNNAETAVAGLGCRPEYQLH